MSNVKELDITKGILIFLVVVGHADIDNTRIIYWFHMPIFFMISGFLMNQKIMNSNDSFSYLFKKLMKLLIPYVSFFLLVTSLSLIFNLEGVDILSWQFAIKALIGGKFLVGQFGVFWFITCLIATIAIYGIIEKYVTSNIYKVILVLVFFLIGHFESYLLQKGINIFVPGNVDTAFVTLGYFYIGIWFRYLVMNKRTYVLNLDLTKILGIICFSVLFLMIFSSYLSDNYIDLKYQKYAHPLATLLIPLIFSALILSCSHLLKKTGFSAFWTLLGQHSLVIMYLHLLFRFIMVNYINYNPYVFIIVGTILPLLISLLLLKNKYTRSLFLGDFNISYFNFKNNMTKGPPTIVIKNGLSSDTLIKDERKTL